MSNWIWVWHWHHLAQIIGVVHEILCSIKTRLIDYIRLTNWQGCNNAFDLALGMIKRHNQRELNMARGRQVHGWLTHLTNEWISLFNQSILSKLREWFKRGKGLSFVHCDEQRNNKESSLLTTNRWPVLCQPTFSKNDKESSLLTTNRWPVLCQPTFSKLDERADSFEKKASEMLTIRPEMQQSKAKLVYSFSTLPWPLPRHVSI